MIVGIHDRDQENESGISFAMPSGADEEGEDEEESDIGVPCMAGGDQVWASKLIRDGNCPQKLILASFCPLLSPNRALSLDPWTPTISAEMVLDHSHPWLMQGVLHICEVVKLMFWCKCNNL